MKHNWEYKKFGDVSKSDLGKTLNQSKDTGELYPYLCAINIQWDEIDLSTIKQAKFDEDEIERFSVRKGDLLICEGGDTGRSAIWDREPMLYQNALHRVRFDKYMNARFALMYLLHLKKIGDIDTKYSKGVTIKHLVKSSLSSIPIPVPPLPTQQSIVSELDTLSGIITECKETLKDYDALEQSIFYDMFGDPVKNEKGWEVKKLGEVAFAQNGLVSPTEEPYCEMIHVGPANIVSGTGELINLKTAKDENLISGKYLFDKDMILYSKIRPNLNKLTIAKFQGLCSADMYPIICGELLNPYYLASVLRHKRFLSYAIENSGRANIPKINREALFQFEMHLPPLPLQQQFASKIEAIEQIKVETREALQEAETLFQARMDYWFN